MQQLSEPEIRKITDAIASMGEIDSKTVENTLDEFGRKLGDDAGIVGSIDSAKNLLLQFLPDERVTEILDEIAQSNVNNVWTELSELDENLLVEFLRKEQDQTVAVILSKIKPDTAAKILPLLGSDRVPNLIERIMEMEGPTGDSLTMIEETLKRDILSQMAVAPQIDEVVTMDSRIFQAGDMDLRTDLLQLDLPDRVALDANKGQLYLNFEKLRVRHLSEVQAVGQLVAKT